MRTFITSGTFQVHLHVHENQQHQEKEPDFPNQQSHVVGIYNKV